MEVEDEMRRASKPAVDVKVGDMVTGTVYNFTDQGAFVFTSERYIAFLHRGRTFESQLLVRRLMLELLLLEKMAE